MTSNTFREINKDGKYLFIYKFYDLDKLSSYLTWQLFINHQYSLIKLFSCLYIRNNE